MRVLVTGGAGFIDSSFIRLALLLALLNVNCRSENREPCYNLGSSYSTSVFWWEI